LLDLYKRNGRVLPKNNEIFDEFDIWVVAHAIGVVDRGGWSSVVGGSVEAVGYQASFEEALAYTVELLPEPKFVTNIGGELKVLAEIGLEGRARVPDTMREILNAPGEALGGDARMELLTDAKVVGRISFAVWTPKIQAVGLCHSRCEWVFNRTDEPLLNNQLMYQTILVPAGTKTLTMEIRGYALIRTIGWLPFPSKFQTRTLTIEVRPLALAV